MDAIDTDVKLVLYGMLARLDGSYMNYRQQIDCMYGMDTCSSSDTDEDGDDMLSLGTPENYNEKTIDSKCDDIESDIHDSDNNDKDLSDPEIDVDLVDESSNSIPVTKGELTIDELPPIEQLQITPDGSLEEVGEVSSILDKIIVVKSHRFTTALDMDTILFLQNGQALGSIFETFGPVVEPFYLVRFNSIMEIQKLNITEKTPVFYSPHSNRQTKYVFVDRLRTVKGSDASWEDNNEPPAECLDFSDDEEERQAKAVLEATKRRNQYDHFLPDHRRNTSSCSTIEKSHCSSEQQEFSIGNMFLSKRDAERKEAERKLNLKNKLVAASLARARRKAARTNLADIPNTIQSATAGASSSIASNNANVLTLVEEAVKTNPSLLSSIISSALSAASAQQPGNFLPVMLPPSAEAPTQPRFLPTIPTSLPPNLMLPPAQNVVVTPSGSSSAEQPRRRLMDPRFVKKQS